ncbi:MAG: PEP-CTERM sorting domain-containing protein [Bryobacterales bacterium]|nr:PEP-CTERM sorting domain-containing protein [Bryobacterales bacterium]
MIKLTLFTLLTLIPAQSAVVLNDNFETGALSPSKWLIPGSGQIVADPLNPNNKVLNFAQLKAGGDLFSVPLDLSNSPTITIEFDYLGIYTGDNVSTDTGGFVIMDIPNSFAGWVLLGTSTAGGPLRPNMLNLTNGVWHHIALTIPATLVGAGNGSKFVLEQWNGSTNAAGNAYFDNILVSTNPVPEPSSLLLAGLGVLLIAAGRQRRTHV